MTRAEKEAAFAAKLAAEDAESVPLAKIDYRELRAMVNRDWPEMVREHADAIKAVHVSERKLVALRMLMVQCAENLGEHAELPPWPREMFNHKSSLASRTGEKRSAKVVGHVHSTAVAKHEAHR